MPSRTQALHRGARDHRQKAQTGTDQANEEAAARHRDELSEMHTRLLQQNVALTTQVHEISQRFATLLQEVHTATCSK